MREALRFAIRRLRRGYGSGELRVLVLALAIAAAAAIAVGLFTDRVRLALEAGAGEQLGADAVITSRDPLPAAPMAALRAAGLRLVTVTSFPSVVARVDGDDTQLATIKGVEAGYPLRGAFRLAREPFGETEAAPPQPGPDEVWVDLRLWQVLGLSLGSRLQVGNIELAVTRLIAEEPGRSSGFGDLAPGLILNAARLPDTGLVGPGSRLEIKLQLGGTAAQLAKAATLDLPPGYRYITPENAQPQVRNSMDRARSFLNIAVLATILLAAAAVALSARQYSLRLRDEVALLKVLGARRAFIRRALALQVLLLGLIGGGLGAVAGVAGQAVLAELAAPVLKITLPPPGWLPLPAVLGLVLVMLAGFALPPVLASVEASPVRVFQRAADRATRGWPGLVAAIVAVALLLWLQAGSVKLAAVVFGGALATAGVLALIAWLLVRGLGGIRARHGIAWRFGLGNIARRRGAAVAQIVALGIALLALLLVSVVRQDLLATWAGKLPATTPNQFLIGILPEQKAALETFFAERGIADLAPQPMVRARLSGLRGTEVSAEDFEDPETRRWINREFNLSWTDRFGDDSEWLEGGPWDTTATGKPWLAVDDYAVERLNLKLGDTLTLDLAGSPVTLEVRAVRKIRWDSFRPNFFLVTPPGVLDAQADAPVQWIASFYLPHERRALLRELIRAFPNVTAIDLDAALNEVRGIVDRIVGALEFIFLFTLLAGVVVMLAVIEGSRADRVRETAVLRTLGASRRVIRQGLLAEYAVLGGLAGAVAAVAAQGVAWGLAVGVLELPYGPRPLLCLVGTLAGALVVMTAGWFSLRRVLDTPPRAVLAGAAA
jgi:putative ABC transport system permease protein